MKLITSDEASIIIAVLIGIFLAACGTVFVSEVIKSY